MDQTRLMGVMERIGQLGSQAGRSFGVRLSVLEPLSECWAVNELADDVNGVTVVSSIMHADHVGMMKLCGGPCLTDEIGPCCLRPDVTGNLHGDQPIELGVVSLPDNSEGPRTQLVEQLETTNAPNGHRFHGERD
jgi:hypothetical protein